MGTTPGLGILGPMLLTTPLFWQDLRVKGDFLEEVIFWLKLQVLVGMEEIREAHFETERVVSVRAAEVHLTLQRKSGSPGILPSSQCPSTSTPPMPAFGENPMVCSGRSLKGPFRPSLETSSKIYFWKRALGPSSPVSIRWGSPSSGSPLVVTARAAGGTMGACGRRSNYWGDRSSLLRVREGLPSLRLEG